MEKEDGSSVCEWRDLEAWILWCLLNEVHFTAFIYALVALSQICSKTSPVVQNSIFGAQKFVDALRKSTDCHVGQRVALHGILRSRLLSFAFVGKLALRERILNNGRDPIPFRCPQELR